MHGYQQFLYLDSKIIGTAKQIIVFFDNGIFQRENTVVLVKKYKHKSAEQMAEILKKSQISFYFINAAEIDALNSGVVFYPFNAQSNCRVAANRKLTHVFITHGESNKAASVKPIIRIYDYIVTAGQAGIDRFLMHKIFTPYDVKEGRLITMGDTFVGSTGLSETGEPCIFYAPTWEGGIELENYSSLENVDLVAKTIVQLSHEYQTKNIVIRPHPNTGHRLKTYWQNLLLLMQKLSINGLQIKVFATNFSANFWQKWKLKCQGVEIIRNLSSYQAKFGLCDISAMETQFLNEDIPYYLYWNKAKQPKALMNSDIYQATSFLQDKQIFIELCDEQKYQNKFKHYLIDESVSSMPVAQKINHLLKQIQFNEEML